MYLPFRDDFFYIINETRLPKSTELFFKYRDLYGISLIILFLYKKDLYKKISDNMPVKVNRFEENHWKINGKFTFPSEYLDPKKNKLEKILYTLFTGLDKKQINSWKLHYEPTLLPTVDDLLKLF